MVTARAPRLLTVDTRLSQKRRPSTYSSARIRMEVQAYVPKQTDPTEGNSARRVVNATRTIAGSDRMVKAKR